MDSNGVSSSFRSIDLLEHLKSKKLIIAEGVLFEFVRRGRVRIGSFVPEVILDSPDSVKLLHQEFVDAGSDVVQAFTVSLFYAENVFLTTSLAIDLFACHIGQRFRDQ